MKAKADNKDEDDSTPVTARPSLQDGRRHTVNYFANVRRRLFDKDRPRGMGRWLNPLFEFARRGVHQDEVSPPKPEECAADEVKTGSPEASTLVLAAADSRAVTLKYISLITLVVQNAALALSMRYGRTREGDMFISSTAVLTSEVAKLLICLGVVFYDHKDFAKFLGDLRTTIWLNLSDTMKVCIPSCVYVIQNNLLYVAASHLDAATYQVTYQLKILTTAIFSIVMLRKKLVMNQWTALVLLVAGVVMVQLAQTDGKSSGPHPHTEQNRLIGFLAAISACVLSGFAGVYFEKILKGSPISVWMRNVQLSLCSIPFAILTCCINDFRVIRTNGYFFGYDFFVWYLVMLQATGGLLVAMVVKYADNILKGFATSLAIVVACVASILFFHFQLSVQFSLGTALVISSIFLYGYQPPAKYGPGISRV